MEEKMLEIWEPLDHYRLSSEMKDAQEAPSEQYARLKWKVARDFCRYNWKWPFTAYGPTFNVISPVQQKTRSQYAKVERRLCRIATRVYVVAATLKVETVGQALHGGGIPRHFHESKRNSSLKGNRFIPIDRSISFAMRIGFATSTINNDNFTFLYSMRFSLSSLIIHRIPFHESKSIVCLYG